MLALLKFSINVMQFLQRDTLSGIVSREFLSPLM